LTKKGTVCAFDVN